MSRKLFLIFILLFSTVLYASDLNQYLPICSYLVDSHELVEHSEYSLCYNEDTEQPEYTIYELTVFELENLGISPRKDDFRVDKKVSTGSATKEDYRNSGYDRGHLVPSGSMTYNEKANSETFYMSNMSPQVGVNFNRGIWKNLEDEVRNYLKNNQDLVSIIVYTIPYVNERKEPVGYIGENEVAIPAGYFKVIYAPKTDTFKCWYLDQFNIPAGKYNLKDYEVSISKVEKDTGLFFAFSKKSMYNKDSRKYNAFNMDISDFLKLSDQLKLNLSQTDIEKNSVLFTQTYLLGHNCKSVLFDFEKDVWKGSYHETMLSDLLKKYDILKENEHASQGTVYFKLFKAGYESGSNEQYLD